jgi:quercetin dioxygenase-like cupin family protein
MDGLRKISVIFFSVFLLGSFSLNVYADDYTSAKATVVKKSSTTASGQKIEYPVTSTPEVTALLVEIPSGKETGWHQHPIPVYAYVLSGVLTVEMGNGGKQEYREGEAIFETVHTPHNGKNLGEEMVRLIVFYTGEEGKPLVVKVPHE